MPIQTQVTGQFEGYTLSQLRAEVLRRLRVTNTARYSVGGTTDDYDWIDDALNRGQENFVRETKCLKTYAIIELKANYRTYRFPWNFLDLEAAYFYDSALTDGYFELSVRSAEEARSIFPDLRTKTGDPTTIYLDRSYGNIWMCGLYPIPAQDGDTITFDSEYGAIGDFVCPNFEFNSEYGIVIRMTDTDEYLFNMDTGVVASIDSMNNNVLLEYYRLPEKLVSTENADGVSGVNYPDIPREYQMSLVYYTVADLLENNPEDSVEFKRSVKYETRFNNEIKRYIDQRKKPFKGRNVQGFASVWSWMNGMDFYSTMP